MMQSEILVPLSDWERQLFTKLVPENHFLRQLEPLIDFEQFRPALDPVMMLKLDLLSMHYRWSDRELMRHTQVNMAVRLFVNLGGDSKLPHHTSMTYFRKRVGAEAIQKIFDEVVAQARRLGLVRDRLRLKDATHVIANIAIPSTIRLVAETRDTVLEAAEPFAQEQVAYEWDRAEAISAVANEDLPDEERLVQRVAHLRQEEAAHGNAVCRRCCVKRC